MSVLALAVAKDNGLDVVTPSAHVHETLLANTETQVLSKLLEIPMSVDEQTEDKVGVQELCQVILMTGFDLTRLKPEDIRDMVVNGGTELRRFYGNLSLFAANIPPNLSDEERARRLRGKADEVLADWRACNEKLPQLRDAVKDAATDKGLDKAIDVAKEAIKAQSICHFVGGLPGIVLVVAVKAGSMLLHKRDAAYPFLNRVEKAVDKSIGALYVPQWRNLAS
jgi:hypothetical protein